ncbi:FAD-dependent oxidoreductase [Vibrio mediterranei]
MSIVTKSHSYDIVIVGGGMSGVCAAISAARNDAKVALVQNRPMLGGNASSEVKMHICGADYHASRTNARETGIIEEILLRNRYMNPQHSFSILDTVLWEFATEEENIDLYLNAHMNDVHVEEGNIKSVTVNQMTTGKKFVFDAPIFVDTSGDANLAFQSGADIRTGREASCEYDEELAPTIADKVMMGNTLMFTSKNLGFPVDFKKPKWAKNYSEEDFNGRDHSNIEAGYWWIELGGTDLDTISDGEDIRDELLKSVYGIWDHIKNGGDHGAENHALDWVAMFSGKRDSRRILGDYVLNANDLFSGKVFDDTVAYGGWPMDMHVKGGMESREQPTNWIETNGLYSIPYRSLYSRNINNLYVGGRNISASHMAFGSTRVMATCAVIGQAIGTAAAKAALKGILPRDMNKHISELQKRLIKDDCYLFGLIDHDESNLALNAKVTSSSEQEGFEAINVINGYQRSSDVESNLWKSKPIEKGSHESVRLFFSEKIEAKEIIINFNSNLSSEIMTTLLKERQDTQAKGIPSCLVKNYTVQVLNDGTVVFKHGINENYQRHNKISLPDGTVFNSLKILVHTTWGDKCAQIYEVKVFK